LEYNQGMSAALPPASEPYRLRLLRLLLALTGISLALLTVVNLIEWLLLDRPGALGDVLFDLVFLLILGLLALLRRGGFHRAAAVLWLLSLILAGVVGQDLPDLNTSLLIFSAPVFTGSFLLTPWASPLLAVGVVALYAGLWALLPTTMALGGSFNLLGAAALLLQGAVAMILARQLEREIAAQEALTARLAASAQDTADVLDALTAILIALTPEGGVRYWNRGAQEAFGLSAAEALGQPLAALPLAWDAAAVQDGLRRCTGRRCAVRLDDIRFTRPDGGEGLLGLTVSRLPNERGFICTGRDVSDQRRMEAQYAQAQQLKSVGQLAAGIAHEINTPIQYVSDNVRFLQTHFSTLLAALDAAAPTAELDYLRREVPLALEQSLEGLAQTAKIVAAMRDYSHPGQEAKVVFDLNRAVESTLLVAQHELRPVAEVQVDLDPSQPRLRGYPNEINQVLLNLLTNAAHAIADHPDAARRAQGRLQVTTRAAGDWVTVTITDNGVGLSEAVRAHLFEPFFTTKELGRGTGQGLTIAQQVVVVRHGGTITAEGAPDVGATFTVRLPVNAEGT
jgi:PAS domain S-box-containing protein